MATNAISYTQTGYFSKTVCDYLAQKPALKDFYNRFPISENFGSQIEEKLKQKGFGQKERTQLVSALQEQYEKLSISNVTQQNIELLQHTNTFTITTGHQLNLFTGPLYFLYKIVSVINLCEQLKNEHPNYNFVPIYWMATEDHDFDEINYFNFEGKKVVWESEQKGAVGRFNTDGLDQVLVQFKQHLGNSTVAKELCELFKKTYVEHDTLAAATRFLANRLFDEYGLVIVDGDDARLKKSFTAFAKAELKPSTSHREVSKTTARLVKAGYGEQVHPREINLFYVKDGLRERIVKKDELFYINETELTFTFDEIIEELEAHPERFSPNALLRPLYQEVILPNLCYVGGGGELAYWLQLKDYFKAVDVVFPMLLLRNSAVIITEKQIDKAQKLGLSVTDLFKNQEALIDQKVKEISSIEIDFSPQREHLKRQFIDLYELAKQTDESFLGAVGAQEKKQLNGLDHLEKRLKKAQKRKLKDHLERITFLQDGLFPKQSLQERTVNFSQIYLEYGEGLIKKVKDSLDPLSPNFTVIEL